MKLRPERLIHSIDSNGHMKPGQKEKVRGWDPKQTPKWMLTQIKE